MSALRYVVYVLKWFPKFILFPCENFEDAATGIVDLLVREANAVVEASNVDADAEESTQVVQCLSCGGNGDNAGSQKAEIQKLTFLVTTVMKWSVEQFQLCSELKKNNMELKVRKRGENRIGFWSKPFLINYYTNWSIKWNKEWAFSPFK